MLSRRDFLRGMAVGGAGVVTGAGMVSVGRRLLASSSGGTAFLPMNDEFEAGNIDWVLPSGNAGTVLFGDTPGEVTMPSGTRIIRLRVPEPPFTVTARCTFLQYDDIDTTFANASLAIGSSDNAATSGAKHYALQWDIAFLGEIGVIDGVWDQYSDTPTHLSPYVLLDEGDTFEVPHWQRMVVNSGTDIDTYYSLNGETWTPYASGVNPNIDVEAVLLLSYACQTRWDWVRFT